MKTKITLTLLGVVLLIGVIPVNLNAQPQPFCPGQHIYFITKKMVFFREDMRKLWEDHIIWTRNVILNIIDDLPGTTDAVTRLLQNQVDIGDAIKPFYGNAAGDQLTGLLQGHIVIAANLLTALKNDDTASFNLANLQWIENADSIVTFLSSANPHWDEAELQTMMYDHLNLTAAEALARKNQDYAGDVIAYENVHIEILEMADILSCGIIRQFPWMFFFGNHREMDTQEVYLTDSDVFLDQNNPNPFNEETVIAYFLPEDVNEAVIKFYNSTGSLIKAVVLQERGVGSINIHAADLRSGIYSYSLVIDGLVKDTKRMIH